MRKRPLAKSWYIAAALLFLAINLGAYSKDKPSFQIAILHYEQGKEILEIYTTDYSGQ